MDHPFPPQDNDPRHIAIMEGWVRRIVNEVAQEMAERIVERVGEIFLTAKNEAQEQRAQMRAIENAIAALNKTRGPRNSA